MTSRLSQGKTRDSGPMTREYPFGVMLTFFAVDLGLLLL